MTSMPPFWQITYFSLCLVNFRVSRFCVSHLNHETFKLCLQNTLNMSKTTRVYFGELQLYPKHVIKLSRYNLGCYREPTRGTPSTSSIITSLSMEELRAYCEIPVDIDVMLSDGPTQNTVGGGDNAVFFTWEKLAVGLRFPVLSLVKQFLHFTRAPLALVHPNVIQILTGCYVLNLLY